jgi:hypothetical protein
VGGCLGRWRTSHTRTDLKYDIAWKAPTSRRQNKTRYNITVVLTKKGLRFVDGVGLVWKFIQGQRTALRCRAHGLK